MQQSQRSVLLDERVEAFVMPPNQAGDAGDHKYYAFEVNYGGKSLTNHAQFGGRFDFAWGDESCYTATCFDLAVGWAATSSPIPAAGESGGLPPKKTIVILELFWQAMGIDPAQTPELSIGLHRAQHAPGGVGAGLAPGQPLSPAEADAVQNEFVWSSWIDPTDKPDEVNFHRPAFFGKLTLEPKDCKPRFGQAACACLAVRLLRPNDLVVLPSPVPSIDQCPSGAVLVRAKYASVCGSDMPYFKAASFKAPSSYWDRDGFCGHEVVGVVTASKSDKFKPGDEVRCTLRASVGGGRVRVYCAAHNGSTQGRASNEVVSSPPVAATRGHHTLPPERQPCEAVTRHCAHAPQLQCLTAASFVRCAKGDGATIVVFQGAHRIKTRVVRRKNARRSPGILPGLWPRGCTTMCSAPL